jgi:hypothetical protein
MTGLELCRRNPGIDNRTNDAPPTACCCRGWAVSASDSTCRPTRDVRDRQRRGSEWLQSGRPTTPRCTRPAAPRRESAVLVPPAVMWDGRAYRANTDDDPRGSDEAGERCSDARATPPSAPGSHDRGTEAEKSSISKLGLFSAQAHDTHAGNLNAHGRRNGGPGQPGRRSRSSTGIKRSGRSRSRAVHLSNSKHFTLLTPWSSR